jgi:hypothetical protein
VAFLLCSPGKFQTAISFPVHVGSTCPVDILFDREPFFRGADLTLDELWSLRAERGLETLVERFRRSRPGCGHAEARRDIDPAERWIAEIQHRLQLRVRFILATPCHLDAEDGVGVVLEDDDDQAKVATGKPEPTNTSCSNGSRNLTPISYS